MTSNDALTLKPARHHVGDRLHRPLEHRGGTAVPGPDQGLPDLLEGADDRAGAGAVGRRRARQPGRARRRRSTSATRARSRATSRLPARAGRDVEHQRSDRRHGPGRGHPSRRRRRVTRTATLKATFTHRGPDRHQVVPDHGQAARRHPAGSAARPASRTSTSSTRRPGRRWPTPARRAPPGNATLVNPGKATLTGAGVTLNPDAYADSLDGRVREAARQRHGRHDRAERRLRHPDRPGQRRRPPPVELRAQDELRRDGQPATRARSSAPTPGACAPA